MPNERIQSPPAPLSGTTLEPDPKHRLAYLSVGGIDRNTQCYQILDTNHIRWFIGDCMAGVCDLWVEPSRAEEAIALLREIQARERLFLHVLTAPGVSWGDWLGHHSMVSTNNQ